MREKVTYRGRGFFSGTTITADQVFYIAIGCVFAIVIIIGSLIVAYFKSAKKGLAQDLGRDSLRYPYEYAKKIAPADALRC